MLAAGRGLQYSGIRCSGFQGHCPERWGCDQGVGVWLRRGKAYHLNSGDRAVPAAPGCSLLRQFCSSKGRDERRQERLTWPGTGNRGQAGGQQNKVLDPALLFTSVCPWAIASFLPFLTMEVVPEDI